MLSKTLALLLSAGLAFAGSARAADWIHVEIDKPGATQVKLKLPMSLAGTALAMCGDRARINAGSIRVGSQDMDVTKLRETWKAVRAAGDSEFISIADQKADVKVSTKAGSLLVDVKEHGASGSTVRVSLPNEVVDALLSGEGNELAIDAALARLATAPKGDLVRIAGADQQVHVWLE
jgi:hypothetical protein